MCGGGQCPLLFFSIDSHIPTFIGAVGTMQRDDLQSLHSEEEKMSSGKQTGRGELLAATVSDFIFNLQGRKQVFCCIFKTL